MVGRLSMRKVSKASSAPRSTSQVFSVQNRLSAPTQAQILVRFCAYIAGYGLARDGDQAGDRAFINHRFRLNDEAQRPVRTRFEAGLP